MGLPPQCPQCLRLRQQAPVPPASVTTARAAPAVTAAGRHAVGPEHPALLAVRHQAPP